MNKFEDMLKLRKLIKKKKPNFLRQDFNVKKLRKKWIKAKGRHSKMRRKMAGHIAMPHPGFGSPRLVKGLNADGLREILVHNINDLNNVGSGCCAVIGSNVGMRKRVEIAKKAVQMKIKIANMPNADEFIKGVEDMLKEKREQKKRRKEKKIASKKESEKKMIDEKKPTKEEEIETKKKVLEKKV